MADASRRSESTSKSLRSGRSSATAATLGGAVVKVECVDYLAASGDGIPAIIDLKREVVVRQEDSQDGEAINAEIEKGLEFSASTPNPELKDEVAASGTASMVNAPFSPVLPEPVEVVDDGETVEADEVEEPVDDLENIQAFLDYIEDPEKKGAGKAVKPDKFSFKEVYLTPIENVPAPGAAESLPPQDPGSEQVTPAQLKPKRKQRRSGLRCVSSNPIQIPGNPFLPGHVGHFAPSTPTQMYRPMAPFHHPLGPFGRRHPMGYGSFDTFNQNVWDFQRSHVSGQTFMYTTPKHATKYVDSPASRHHYPVTSDCLYDSSKCSRLVGGQVGCASVSRPRFPPPSSTVTSKDVPETIISGPVVKKSKICNKDEVGEKSSSELQIDLKGNSPTAFKDNLEETTDVVASDSPMKESRVSTDLTKSASGTASSSGNGSSGYTSGTEESGSATKQSGMFDHPNKSVYQHLYNSQPLLGTGNLAQWPPQPAFYYQSNYYTGNITSNTINPSAQEPKPATMFSASALPQFVVNQQQQYFNRYFQPPSLRPYYHGGYGPGITQHPQPHLIQAPPPQMQTPAQSQSGQVQHPIIPRVTNDATFAASCPSTTCSDSTPRQNVEVKSNFEEMAPFTNYETKADFADVLENVANTNVTTAAATSPMGQILLEDYSQPQQQDLSGNGNGQDIDFVMPGECINQIQGVSNSDGYGHVEVVDGAAFAGQQGDALSAVVQMTALPAPSDGHHQVIVDQAGQSFHITGDLNDPDGHQYVGLVGSNPNNPMTMRMLTSQDIKPVMLPPANDYQMHPGVGSHQGNPNKKPRTIFSDAQCSKMKEVFRHTPYISRQMRAELAKSLDISQDTIAVWFKNQRSKLKKQYNVQKEAEGWPQ